LKLVLRLAIEDSFYPSDGLAHRFGIDQLTQEERVSFSLNDGKRVEKVTDVVMGRGAVVRKLSFTHLP
jgi:hypothetical protein